MMTQTLSANMTLEQATYERMSPLLNQTFYLHSDQDSKHEITLVEVEKSSIKPAAAYSWQKQSEASYKPQRTPFVMVFRFPVDHVVQQGIYQISHPAEGTFEGMFCVPIAKDGGGLYFETIFS